MNNQMSYQENRKKHLIEYARSDVRLRNAIGGTWQGKGQYDHILKMNDSKDKAEQRQVIESCHLYKFNLTLDMIPQGKQHTYAHHLNSSQILCYCYFRRMLDNDGHPDDKLVNLMAQHGINISRSAVCKFEYDEYKKHRDGTEFDFHIQDGSLEVFFEIKYTEYGFGSLTIPVNSKYVKKFERTYAKLLQNCKCLDKDMSADSFFSSYQLNRNVVRITDEEKYTIFLYPRNNSNLESEFNEFHKTILEPYKDHVMSWHWEDIVSNDEEPELYEKYFK